MKKTFGFLLVAFVMGICTPVLFGLVTGPSDCGGCGGLGATAACTGCDGSSTHKATCDACCLGTDCKAKSALSELVP